MALARGVRDVSGSGRGFLCRLRSGQSVRTPFPVSADVRDVDQAIPNVRIIARGASALFDGTQYFLAGGADITLLHTIATASTTAVYRARVRALLTGAHHAISDGRFLAQQDGALISGA
jgi:hypothetical protein